MQSSKYFLSAKTCWYFFFFLNPLILWTQQALNLDFERRSLDTNSAWGWSAELFSTVETDLDEEIRQAGILSFRMSCQELDTQRMRFFLEPYAMRNHQITVNGWIKTSDLSGHASITLGYYPFSKGGDSKLVERTSLPMSGTRDWQKVSIASDFPTDVASAFITINHAGEGTSWFDNLGLSIDGIDVAHLEVDRPFSKKELRRLTHLSSQLRTVKANRVGAFQEEQVKDLKSFGRQVAHCQLIGMGESTHGTSEFFRLKHRILEYAVNMLGVRIFALEDNQLVVRKINDFVKGGQGSARASMQGLFSVWQNKEVHDLIQWVRNFNDLHPDSQVTFAGYDMQDWETPLDSLNSYLDQYLSSLRRKVETQLSHLASRDVLKGHPHDSIRREWFQSALEVYELVYGEEQRLLRAAVGAKDSMRIYWGSQYARLVKQSAEHWYRGHQSLYRDAAMAENISWMLGMHPSQSKMLIWAHDVHISKGQHPDPAQNIYGGLSMGAHLEKKFGENYKSFGIWTFKGTYLGQPNYSDFSRVHCPLYEAPIGSLEEALHQIASSRNWYGLFLDLSAAHGLNWLERPLPTRFANHVNMEYGFWTRYSIPYQFDGIFFIDQTNSAGGY